MTLSISSPCMSSLGFGGMGPDVMTSRFSYSVFCMTFPSAILPERNILIPWWLERLNFSCSVGLRISRFRTIVFLLAILMIAARLTQMVVFPSPLMVDVTAMTWERSLRTINCRSVRRFLNDSATADLGDISTLSLLLSSFICGITPKIGTFVRRLTSSSVLILSSKKFLRKARVIPVISPKISPTSTISLRFGLTGFSGSSAASMILFLLTVEALMIAVSERFSSR